MLRGLTFARRSYNLAEILRAKNIKRSTFEDRWRRGLFLFTQQLNAETAYWMATHRSGNDNKEGLDTRKKHIALLTYKAG